jgi:hypothetical protein
MRIGRSFNDENQGKQYFSSRLWRYYDTIISKEFRRLLYSPNEALQAWKKAEQSNVEQQLQHSCRKIRTTMTADKYIKSYKSFVLFL